MASERTILIPCKLYRGGTSRGVLFDERDLPYPRDVRERILLRVMGSPDPRQIDGVGGATSLTSKAMVIGPPAEAGAPVRMLFAQVRVDRPVVDWGGNCGNLTAAVGPYAIESGLVSPVEPTTEVHIRSENTGLEVRANVPVEGGGVQTEGDYEIAGVPGRGARIDLEWLRPGGSVTGKLLPTGNPVDRVRLADGRSLDVSIVDAANPVVFFDARALGLRGSELPAEIETRGDTLRVLEEVRSIAAEMLGIAPAAEATRVSPGLPKVAVVGPPAAYQTSRGQHGAESHDVHGRLMSMQTAHRAYAVTGAICTAVAAVLPGTVVHGCRQGGEDDSGTIRIAHPAGVMDVRVEMDLSASPARVLSAWVGRTARLIMSGYAHVPASILDAGEGA